MKCTKPVIKMAKIACEDQDFSKTLSDTDSDGSMILSAARYGDNNCMFIIASVYSGYVLGKTGQEAYKRLNKICEK